MDIIARKQDILEHYKATSSHDREIYIMGRVQPALDDNEKWGVPKLQSSPSPRKLLVTGTGRCGTDWFSRAFTQLGYDLPHEIVGTFGTSSKWFYIDSDWYPMIPYQALGVAHVGERKSDYQFEKVIHLVRNPLTCISSMMAVFHQLDYEFMEDNQVTLWTLTGESPLFQAMACWYETNSYIERHKPCDPKDYLLVHIEHVREEWPRIAKFCGIQNQYPDLPASNHAKDYRRHPTLPLTYEQLRTEDIGLGGAIQLMAKRYGYEE